MDSFDEHVQAVLDDYSKFLRAKQLAPSKHQPYVVRWMQASARRWSPAVGAWRSHRPCGRVGPSDGIAMHIMLFLTSRSQKIHVCLFFVFHLVSLEKLNNCQWAPTVPGS